jgi:hypothetical protein
LRKLLLSVVLTALFAVGDAAQATAAPSSIHLSIAPKVQLVPADPFSGLPNTLNVPLTITCPATFGFVSVGVSVSQASTGAVAQGGPFVQCTGSPVTTIVTPFSFAVSFALGRARVEARAASIAEFVTDVRQVSVVL